MRPLRRHSGITLGEAIPVGWLTNAQANSGNLALNSTIPADQRARVKLVGIAGAQATNLFEDQDEAQGQSIMLFTPALTDKLLACCSNTMLTALTLQDGNRYLSAVETEIKGVLPKGLPFVYVQVEDRVAIANDTLRPEAIALAVFGGIAGIAALLIAGQVVSRRHPPESRRPRHHPGPRGQPLHDLLRRPDRHARRRGGRLRPGRAGGPLPLTAGAAGTGAAVPARRGPRRLGGDRSRRGRPAAVARGDRGPGFVARSTGQSTRAVASEPPRHA